MPAAPSVLRPFSFRLTIPDLPGVMNTREWMGKCNIRRAGAYVWMTGMHVPVTGGQISCAGKADAALTSMWSMIACISSRTERRT